MQINLVSPRDRNQAFEDPEDRSLVTAKVVQNRPTKLVFEVRNTSGTFLSKVFFQMEQFFCFPVKCIVRATIVKHVT